jgi:hypothetical protein
MRFWYRNVPAMLPADAVWRIEPGSKAGEYRVRIDRPTAKAVDLAEAIAAVVLETSSSIPQTALDEPGKGRR